MHISNMTFKEGAELKIHMRLKGDCTTFSINIGHDSENLALHFNPRFDENQIVCNSMSGGGWGEEHRDVNLPFSPGEETKFSINFNMEYFFIKLPDGSTISFPNRLGDVKYKHLDIRGDARMIGLKMK
ncbi:hypothetical protein CRUP_029949 [Coryphaenoides rupestris]|nr:hypothetical protein CRUP_029949 [Coryphaenoides rupestris]